MVVASALRRLGRDQGGQALVEFVLVVPLLMLLVVGIFEFSRLHYTRLTIRHAVAEAARFGVTGQRLADPESGELLTRSASIVQVMTDRARGLSVDVEQIRMDPADGGLPGEIVRIEATYRFNFLTAAIIRSFAPPFVDFTVATSVRNEPVF